MNTTGKAYDLERLAHVVRERRIALDMSLNDVSAAGGPSDTKMSQIENASPTPPRRDVRKRLDAVLRWQDGSTWAVMLGGDPVERDEDEDEWETLERALRNVRLSPMQRRAIEAILDLDRHGRSQHYLLGNEQRAV